MALVLIPKTEAFVYVDTTPSPLERTPNRDPLRQLGYGIIRPFQRDEKNDFANAGGVELVKSCVGQILGMRGSNLKLQGELDWDPQRGSLLWLLRQKGNDTVLGQLGRLYVIDCLKRYEPRVAVRSVRVSREAGPNGPDNVLLILLKYDVLAAPGPGNQVLFPNVDQTVTLPQAA